ncbi:MAG: DUF4397 domain-containing protein [Ginsengibacter sp.]
MKKMLNYVKQQRWLVLLLGVTILFSACKKEVDTPQTPASGLMVFNLIPGHSAVGFVMSNKIITNAPLAYTNYSGNYISVYSGSRDVKLYDVTGDSTITDVNQQFEQDKYYSAFALGADGNYRTVIVDDNLNSIPDSTNKAFVRYINAIPDSSKPMVTIAEGGTNVVDDMASYAKVSGFESVNPGEITIAISNGTNISASRTITVEKGKVYTILLLGLPGATDEATKVQIKFITNGSVS